MLLIDSNWTNPFPWLHGIVKCSSDALHTSESHLNIVLWLLWIRTYLSHMSFCFSPISRFKIVCKTLKKLCMFTWINFHSESLNFTNNYKETWIKHSILMYKLKGEIVFSCKMQCNNHYFIYNLRIFFTVYLENVQSWIWNLEGNSSENLIAMN